MFTIMDKMIWRNVCRMKYLAIFIFCLLVIIPYSLQAAILPKEQVSTNLKNGSFLDKIILNIESFDFLSFLNKGIPKFVDRFPFFSFLANSPSNIPAENNYQNTTDNRRKIVDNDVDEVFHIVLFLSVVGGLFIIIYFGFFTQRGHQRERAFSAIRCTHWLAVMALPSGFGQLSLLPKGQG